MSFIVNRLSRLSVSFLLVALLVGMFQGSAQAQVASGGGTQFADQHLTGHAGKAVVGKGKTGGNGCLSVTNDADSGGLATITPAETDDCEGANTKVTTTGNFKGTVDDLSDGETVNLGTSNDVTVNGNGGTVNVSTGGHSTVTVNNASGGSPMAVNVGGSSITLQPGGSITVNT